MRIFDKRDICIGNNCGSCNAFFGRAFRAAENIAARRGLSEKYLERIVKAMKNENLILSTRGAMGGYRLARRPEDITVLDVLRSVEGELAPVECLTKETNCGIACEDCLTRGVWADMWREILGVTENVSVADITKEVVDRAGE